MICISRKAFVVALCVVGLLALIFCAWAGVSNGSPASFKTNGDLISGWYWLRSGNHTATWMFTSNTFRGYRNVYINFSPLMTNGVSGGAGYCSDVAVAVDYGKGNVEPMQIQMFNPYRPQDTSNSSGIGYQCYGHSMGRLSIPANCKSFKVTVMWPVITKSTCHIAVNKDCMYLGRN